MTPNSFVFDDAFFSHPVPSNNASQSGRKKNHKVILIILALALIFIAVWFGLIRTSMPLVSIELNGIRGLERDVILSHAGITNQTSFFSVNTALMKSKLESFVIVESADVVKQFPDKIYIDLHPRIPVAVSLASIDRKSTPLFIDRHGVICKIGISDSESKMQASTLPILSGLNLDNVSLGMRLPASCKKVLESIAKINVDNSMLLSSISEIQIHERLYDGIELILYPVNSNIRVRAESELNEETLKYMMLVIDVLQEKGTDIDEIDFRTGTVSYKIKETFNG